MGTLSKVQIAEKDAARPENCPNFGTGRTCGKAYDKGCRVDPCLTVGKLKEQEREAKRTGVRVKGSTATKRVLQLDRNDNTFSKNWVFHDTCCRANVWKFKTFPCFPMRTVDDRTADVR